MKSILLYANDDTGLDGRIEAALDLAEAGQGHLTCLQAMPYDSYVLTDPFGGIYAIPEVLERLEQKKAATRQRVETRLRRAQVPWTWLDYVGEPASLLVERSRLADVIVLSLPNGEEPDRTAALAADVALHARSLTLAVPADCQSFDPAGRTLVAWNGSPESSHALRLALPLLTQAKAVDVLTVTEEAGADFPATQACEYLGYHGIRPELHEHRSGERSIAQCILDCAAALDASYIVMGAYGHSRLREAVLGGVTRTMLRDGKRPLLLGH
jgi:nucleotide-binding universal stress UspA family protein